MADADLVFVFRVRSVEAMAASARSVLFIARLSSAEEGFRALRDRLPEGWDVELTGYRLTPETVERLALRPGEIRSLA